LDPGRPGNGNIRRRNLPSPARLKQGLTFRVRAAPMFAEEENRVSQPRQFSYYRADTCYQRWYQRGIFCLLAIMLWAKLIAVSIGHSIQW
jgi:hypothetical protein